MCKFCLCKLSCYCRQSPVFYPPFSNETETKIKRKQTIDIEPSIYVIFRQIVLCRVTLGKPFFQFTAMKMAHAPPGHHSVIGRPNSGGLCYPEYVVYRGEQVSFCLGIALEKDVEFFESFPVFLIFP